ncbi:MAG: hypothetical protein WCF85_05780 [Rhodospirillaceae bacterium]
MIKGIGIVSVMSALLVLSGCADPIGSAGDPSPGAAKRAACERSCNRDYDVCSDSGGGGRGGGAFYGPAAACERQTRSCLERCQTITIQQQKPAAKKDSKEGGQ